MISRPDILKRNFRNFNFYTGYARVSAFFLKIISGVIDYAGNSLDVNLKNFFRVEVFFPISALSPLKSVTPAAVVKSTIGCQTSLTQQGCTQGERVWHPTFTNVHVQFKFNLTNKEKFCIIICPAMS